MEADPEILDGSGAPAESDPEISLEKAKEKQRNRRANQIRKLLRVLHRDIGYFLTGLVVIYSVSGIAVNHIDDWNPSYRIEHHEATLEIQPQWWDPESAQADLDQLETAVRQGLSLEPSQVQGRRRTSLESFVVYLAHGGEIQVQLPTGKTKVKRVTPRPILFEANVLHLNHLKGNWTYIADAFSVLLIFLALSGLALLKGKNGFFGRGKWFFLAGLLVPILGWVAYFEKAAS